MKIQSLFAASIIFFFCTGAFAEAVTGLCKDGTAYTGASKRGACRGHKGVKEWYGDNAAAGTTAPAAAPAAAAVSAPAPGGGTATGICKDGTPYTGASKKGACRGHKGLKEWYGDSAAANTPAAAAPAAATQATVDGRVTGMCNDGTAYTGSSKRGACRGHNGLKEWYADKAALGASKTATPATTTSPAAATATTAGGAATGVCKDGTIYTGPTKRGACRGHKGVKEWYADQQQAPAVQGATPATAPAPAAVPPAPKAAPAPVAPTATTPAAAAPPARAATVPAPAAGSGQVWVNTRSKIYHCEGSKFYGNTKEGEYMTEAQAQAQGYNANRKKVCN